MSRRARRLAFVLIDGVSERVVMSAAIFGRTASPAPSMSSARAAFTSPSTYFSSRSSHLSLRTRWDSYCGFFMAYSVKNSLPAAACIETHSGLPSIPRNSSSHSPPADSIKESPAATSHR